MVRIKDLPQHVGETVTVNGWLYNKRTSGKLQFPIVRDGSGSVQCVVFKKEVSEETWENVEKVTQESSVRITGSVRAEPRAPGGVELGVESFEVIQLSQDFPITPKEHGTAFLMDQRHLWLRSSKQHAVLRIRNEIEKGDPRLLLRPRFRAHRLADPHRQRRRGNVDAVRDRLLRREGVPLAVGPALPRARRGGVRKRLLLRPDVPRGEVEDAPAPHGVLDGRARGRVPRVRRPAGSRRGVHRIHRRPLSRPLPGRVENAGARSLEARERQAAVPAHHVPRGDRGAEEERRSKPSSATTSAATRRRSSPTRSRSR